MGRFLFSQLRAGVPFAVICLLFLFTASLSFAASPIILTDTTDALVMGRHLDYLADPGGALTIADVGSAAMARRFTPSTRDVPNFGVTKSAYWFRFTIDNRSVGQRQWLIELNQPLMDYADLYIANGDGSFRVLYSGDKRPLDSRSIGSHNILFPLPSEPGRITCYLRGQIDGRSQFPLYLYSAGRFSQVENLRNSIYGIYVGYALTIALVCLSLYLFIREKSFVYYVFYILSTAVYHLTLGGYLYSLVFPRQPLIHDYWVVLICFPAMCGGAIFTREFLHTGRNAPFSDKGLRLWLRINLVLPPLVFILPMVHTKTMLLLDVVTVTLLLVLAAAEAVKNGYRPARYLLASRILHEVSFVMFMLVSFDRLDYSPNLELLLLSSPFLDGILIAFAQGEKFNMLKRQVNALVDDLQEEVRERTTANLALEQQMAERLRLEREVVKISDDERRNISHQLHDGLCQQLAGIRVHFAALEDRFSGEPVAERLQPMASLLDDAVDHAYDLSRGLWSMDADGKGAIPDLHGLVHELAPLGSIPITVEQRHSCDSCSGDSLLQVCLIAREAVANALKHAAASHIHILLQCGAGDGILLEVRDDGRGLGQGEKRTKVGGMGIGIMRHRAVMVGGELHLGPGEAGGTVLVCTAPCCRVL